MSDREETALEAKFSILIDDFQRFRQEENSKWGRFLDAQREEDKTLTGILSMLRWHTLIGGVVITGAFLYGIYSFNMITANRTSIDHAVTSEAYFSENRSTTVEMIELYKKGKLCEQTILSVYNKE